MYWGRKTSHWNQKKKLHSPVDLGCGGEAAIKLKTRLEAKTR